MNSLMRLRTRRALVALFAFCVGASCLLGTTASRAADNPKITMVVAKRGTLVIELYPDAAPKTVAHILNLVKKKFYDGIKIHRVVADFVVQWGDDKTKNITPEQFNENLVGTHGSGTGYVPLEVKLPHEQYTLGMARSQQPDSGDSQMFINLKANHQLDSGYCVFGKVIKGQELSEKLAVGDVITSIRIEGKGDGKTDGKTPPKETKKAKE